MPFHEDNETVLRERISLDKANPDVLRDEITTIDHALTHPWTISKTYRRDPTQIWFQWNCAEDNHHVLIGKEDYFLSADGLLMPGKRICDISGHRGIDRAEVSAKGRAGRRDRKCPLSQLAPGVIP
jgi:hypothetical protein